MARRGGEPVKIKSAEKDELIAELRQRLYELKNQERDYKGVNDEIISYENRCKVMSDDKMRTQMEGRARLDRDMDEIADLRKQVDDIKFLLQEKQKQNYDLADELARSKRALEEKHFESQRLNEDSAKKSDQNQDLREHMAHLDRELEALKAQKAENWREISRLKEANDAKQKESVQQTERIKAMDYELARTQQRIEDQQKAIDAKNYDLRNKQMMLDDTQNEVARYREANNRLGQENAMLRQDMEKTMAEAYEVRKENEYQQNRNQDVAGQIREQEMRLKDKEEQQYIARKELEAQKSVCQQMRESNMDMLEEKEALEKHAAVLTSQNNEIQRELYRFVETDEEVRQQLDRKGRIYGMKSQNERQLHSSHLRVEEARSRSPQRRSPSKW